MEGVTVLSFTSDSSKHALAAQLPVGVSDAPDVG
jgi:hypothetical protein